MDKNNIEILKKEYTDETRAKIIDAIVAKYKLLSSFNGNQNGFIEVVTISGESVDKVRVVVDNLGGKYDDLGHGFGVVTIPQDKLADLLASQVIQYAELPISLYTSDEGSNRASCVQRAQAGYSVTGKGVLIGFIDSGIDYTHPAFRLATGETRIEYIYDLSLGGKTFSKQEINEALKSVNPYDIVNSRDLTEHGTHVAGIACAGGKINPKYYGVAPESSIIAVKVTRGNFTFSNDLMKGIKFLIDKSKELIMPLIINISMSTNDGPHDGTSLLEKYIQTITELEKTTICVAAGNEGDAAHHVGGKLERDKEVVFNIASDEKAVILNLYKSLLPTISAELISSTGKSTGAIEVKEGIKEGILGTDKFVIYNTGPKPFDMLGEISIAIIAGNGRYVSEGNWKLKIEVLNNYTGEYDIWLPIAEGLNEKTKFLQPNPNDTLGVPATVQGVISVGSYNYFTNNISSFSGRGPLVSVERIKPDLVAPGEDIFSAVPGGSFDTKTGTSMASPQVAGICALISEWAILKGNDPYAYGDRLKYHLLQGCKRNRTDILYPNNSWGYGEVCAYSSLEVITDILSGIRSDSECKNLYSDFSYSKVTPDYNIRDTVAVLFSYKSQSELNNLSEYLNAVIYDISNNFAVAYIPIENINKMKDGSMGVKFVYELDVPQLFTLNTISPIESSESTVFANNPYLDLNGEGVLVGILDSGIDYLNKEFISEDNTTRITAIWDQNGGGNCSNIELGRLYNEIDINRAIKSSLDGNDPYLIVDSKDEVGHGTQMASIIAARGYNPLVRGILPNSKIIMVKLRELGVKQLEYTKVGIPNPQSKVYGDSSIVLGIKFLVGKARELNKPMVIYLPVGTNIGAHNGTSTVEQFISEVNRNPGIVVTTCTGNEGDSETHVEGKFEKPGEIKDIELKVGKDQVNLAIEIYIDQPDIVAISVISPSGEIVDKIPARDKAEKIVKFIYEGTEMSIKYYIPNYFDGDEVILIKARNIKDGIWRFKLTGEYIVSGKYAAWIPQRALLSKDTKFLNPSQYTTLMIPATAQRIISTAFYNQNNNAVAGISGRGFTRDGRIKPDIAAGGIDQDVTTPGGNIAKISGSSVAGAVVAGCIGMLLEWAVIKGNDSYIETSEIRALIIRGAYMRAGEEYPNREWGYGGINMKRVFDGIRGNLKGGLVKEQSVRSNNYEYEEYEVNKLFVRKPKGM